MGDGTCHMLTRWKNLGLDFDRTVHARLQMTNLDMAERHHRVLSRFWAQKIFSTCSNSQTAMTSGSRCFGVLELLHGGGGGPRWACESRSLCAFVTFFCGADRAGGTSFCSAAFLNLPLLLIVGGGPAASCTIKCCGLSKRVAMFALVFQGIEQMHNLSDDQADCTSTVWAS